MYQAGSFAQLLRSWRTGRRGERALRVGRNVLFLGLTSLVTDISSEMISAVLPLYVVYSLELSPLHLGVIDGLYQGVAALVRVSAGVVADRSRRLKEVAGLGYALSAICKLGLVVIGGSAPVLAGLVVIDRAGKGIRTAPRDAILSLSAPGEALGAAFGVHRALDTAGAMLGPLVAFGLLAIAPAAFDAVFVVSFCVAVIGVALFALFVEGRSAPVVPRGGEARVGLPGLLRLPGFGAVIVVGTVLSAGAISDGLVYVVLQKRVQFQASWLPLLYVASALVYMLLAVPLGRLADRVGPARVYVGGYAALAAMYGVLLLVPPGTGMVVATVVLVGTSYAATDGVLMALATPTLPAEVRTTGLAVLTTSTTLARLLGSVVFGAVWTWWGADRALLGFLLVLALAAALSALTWGRGRRA